MQLSNFRAVLRYFRISPATVTVILAVVIGILGGFGALFFKKLIFVLQDFFWSTPDITPETLFAAQWYRRLLLPALGGLIVGPLIYFLAREARGHGVPEVMIAVITRNSVIRPIVVLVKTFASSISISTGGSVGREGPIVQIGAAIASTTGQMLRVSPTVLKTLVGCGVAAGISATFNAPIAGALFALELIVSDFGLTPFTPILVASVAATAVTRQFQGNVIEFELPDFAMISHWEFGLYLVLGLIAGIVGWFFSRSLYKVDDFFENTKIPQWLRPAIGGLIVGVIAIKYPHIMGVGYGTIRGLFEGNLTLNIMLFLIVLKIFATSITIGSGGSGGIFAPSLFIGAMLGGAFGTIVHQVFPGMTASMGAYALVGMAAVNAASTLAPLSAIIILFELTNQYGIILPLMFTVVMATFISRKLSAESIYTEKLRRRGIDAHHGEDLNILRSIPVRDVIRHDEALFCETMELDTLIRIAMEGRRNTIFTVDEDGKFTGAVSLEDLKYILIHPKELRHVHHMMDFQKKFTPVHIDEMLDTVIELFAETGFDRLPVVDRQQHIIGSVVISDIIRRYSLEVAKRNIAMELGAMIPAHDQPSTLHMGGNNIITEIDVPKWMVGKELRKLALRSKYNVSVFVVKEHKPDTEPEFITPNGEYIFRQGDTMLVSGSEKDVELLKKPHKFEYQDEQN